MAQNMVDTAASVGGFQTLVSAVQAAGLEDKLKGPGPFTGFAVPDEIFAQLPKEAVEGLMADPQGALKGVLMYHLLEGRYAMADFADGQEIATMAGPPVKITRQGEKVMVNDVEIVQGDIEGGNAYVHVLNGVLMPPA